MATLRVASQVPYFEIVSGMFFVFPQVECLGANSCCHELVTRWVKETTEPPVSRELQPPQVPTAIQGSPLRWVHALVISVEERPGSPMVSKFGI